MDFKNREAIGDIRRCRESRHVTGCDNHLYENLLSSAKIPFAVTWLVL